MSRISERIATVREHIASAAERRGTDRSTVTLVAVTKTVPASAIAEAVSAGISDIGESRVQEALEKRSMLGDADLKWHLVGHLQRNKVNRALEVFNVVQSLDSLRLAREISKRAQNLQMALPVLIQVNTEDEEGKHGFGVDQLLTVIPEIAKLRGVSVRGLMTIPPYFDDPEESRPAFRRLRELSEEIRDRAIDGVHMEELSMGMSEDYVVAVEEGATMVRVGRAIFGDRG